MMLRLTLFVIATLRKAPGLHRFVWRVRQTFRRFQRIIFVRKPVLDVGPFLKQAILEGKPFAAGKIGKYEILGLCAYLKRDKHLRDGMVPPPYPAYAEMVLFENAGVFPKDEKIFDRFGAMFLDAVERCDFLAAWEIEGETEIFRHHCRDSQLATLQSLEPYYSQDPWSAALEGKRVLVISPFVDTIRHQYAMKDALWDNPRVLPAFELLLLRTPFSAGIATPPSPDWFTALAGLKAGMDATEYDVAIIGAGAFSIPLAVHAKQTGKVGIHLGGPAQTLFGIVGKRWLVNKHFKLNRFIKDSWKSPSPEETPEGSVKIEGGCYW